jgi:hypothetical protein
MLYWLTGSLMGLLTTPYKEKQLLFAKIKNFFEKEFHWQQQNGDLKCENFESLRVSHHIDNKLYHGIKIFKTVPLYQVNSLLSLLHMTSM